DVENEDLVNMPNWLPLAFRIDGGEWVRPEDATVHEYRMELRLRSGTLVRRMRLEDADGRITAIESERFAHMHRPHLAALRLTVTPENWEGVIEFRAALDGRVRNDGVARYRKLRGDHLVPIDA